MANKAVKQKLLLFMEQNKHLVEENRWEEIYSKLSEEPGEWIMNSFTELLLSLNFNPLHYMNHVPERFLIRAEGVKKIVIPSTVITIGNNAFYHCPNLESVKISDSVKKIGVGAFSYCTDLESVEIPDSVEIIDAYAFYNCTDLKSIEIPDGVGIINAYTFYNCTHLKSIRIPKSIREIREEAFFSCIHLMDVYYAGSESDWSKIKIEEGNEDLLHSIHFNN